MNSAPLTPDRPTHRSRVTELINQSKSPADSFDEVEQPRISPERKAYILAVLRNNLPKLILEWREKTDKNAKYASLCVLDAFQGRLSNGLATNSKKSKLMFTIFYIQTSDWFLHIVVLSSILHTLMVFFEPTGQECSGYLSPFTVSVIHVVVFLIQLADVVLKMIYQGFWEYMAHDWQQLYGTTVFLHFFDLLVFRKTSLTNPLRPVIGLLRARSVRRFFSVVKLMTPSLSETLSPLVAFLMIIAVWCNVWFPRVVEDNQIESLSYNWLWLLLTNDTYDRLIPSDVERHPLYIIFFFTVLYIGQRFILSVILGATFDIFTAFTSKQVKKERLKMMQGLVKAFTALDEYKSGFISDQVWRALMLNLYPSMSMEEIALYYELISAGDRRGISLLQFLSLHDVLSFKFERTGGVSIHESQQMLYRYVEYFKDVVFVPVTQTMTKTTNTVLPLVEKKMLLQYLNWADILMLNLAVHDYALPYTGGIVTPCTLITFVYIGEFLLRTAACDGRVMELVLQNESIYEWIFVAGTVGMMLLRLSLPVLGVAIPSVFQLLTPGRIQDLRTSFRCMRCCRIFHIHGDLAAFMTAIIAVAPIFMQNMMFAVIVAYIFSMLGHIFFGAQLTAWSTPVRAMITVQQLFLPVNLLDVMEEAMAAVHPIAIVYFLGFFLMSLIIFNLSLTIIIEWYSECLKEKPSDSTKDNEKYDQLFKSILARALARKILSNKSETTSFHNYRMVRADGFGSDHRMKFVEGTAAITKKDLASCQKYAKIDLVKMFEEHNKKLKDITWEADFLHEVEGSKVCIVQHFSKGDVICRKDQPATQGFLLTEGYVDIIHASGDPRKTVSMGPINFLGSMCIVPAGVNANTVVASDDVSGFVITRDAVLHELDQVISGQLVRMAFKTNENYARLLEAKRAARHMQLMKRNTFGPEQTPSQK
mmetsp:Transcript_26414/g.39191  ORF Transcript_26414/g.39191 Transcript_26414/m.39191 type:complete len:931 (+) Transcript_26414:243-3035(+)|eukprot:CAMPEP_0185039552 /NCGR_PEP_ID=MMETSP1103-20130426/36496_1 /TAXON_ID=36769 /ORGANISM="Paraphysomonas bandaiensis, Strain Caron Lab Isolate" /LENGTH=930 /DNA_ID=CAMNT_0027578481 /DNA_START=192 /DNA_END=2984 /DNA_ORIENTATION=+